MNEFIFSPNVFTYELSDSVNKRINNSFKKSLEKIFLQALFNLNKRHVHLCTFDTLLVCDQLKERFPKIHNVSSPLYYYIVLTMSIRLSAKIPSLFKHYKKRLNFGDGLLH